MENQSELTLHFDLACTSPHELLCAVRAKSSHVSRVEDSNSAMPALTLVNARGQDFIGAGLREAEVSVQGWLGHFGFCSFGDGQADIEGNVGDFFGHSIASGMLIVRGNARNGVGALGVGGLIAIYGGVEDRVGVGLQGADIVVRGSVANHAGLGMQSGTLVIGGNAGLLLGHGMSGGTIYIRGDAESISPDAEEQRLREPDRLKIGMLMLKSNIKSSGKEYRVFRAAREES